MKQQAFQQKHAEFWTRFESRIRVLESRQHRTRSTELASGFVEDYRCLCYQLALARSRNYSPQLIESLNNLVLRGHQLLYQRKPQLLQQIIHFVVAGFPQLVRQQRRYCLLAAALFYLPGVLCCLLVWWRADLIYLLVDSSMLNQMNEMYGSGERQVREAESDFMMFGYYIENNIGIGFQTFASGILFGLGSIFYLVFNGALFGSLSAYMLNQGFQQSFFSFVITHGAFELTAIVFAGAAGLKLGFSLLAPGQRSRIDALKQEASTAIQLMYGVTLMLLTAAFVEAFWSSSGLVLAWGKYLVGSICWLLVAIYFWRAGKREWT